MTSSDLDGCVLFGRYQVEASLFFVLLTVAETLEKNVGLVRLADSHHFDIFISKSDNFGEGELANFTLELSKIV